MCVCYIGQSRTHAFDLVQNSAFDEGHSLPLFSLGIYPRDSCQGCQQWIQLLQFFLWPNKTASQSPKRAMSFLRQSVTVRILALSNMASGVVTTVPGEKSGDTKAVTCSLKASTREAHPEGSHLPFIQVCFSKRAPKRLYTGIMIISVLQ